MKTTLQPTTQTGANNMHAQPHTRQQSIAREFGQPFTDVVLGFAVDGYSVSATAAILGYSRGSFYTLMKRWGWLDKFDRGQRTLAPRQAQEARQGEAGNRKAVEAMIAANPNYLRFTLDGIYDTLAGHAKRRGLSRNTVYSRRKRRGDDWDYVLDKRSHDPKRPRGWDQE